MSVWQKIAGLFEPKPLNSKAKKREVVVMGAGHANSLASANADASGKDGDTAAPLGTARPGSDSTSETNPGLNAVTDTDPETESASEPSIDTAPFATVRWDSDSEAPDDSHIEGHSKAAADAITLAERERKEQLDRLEANYSKVLSVIEKVDRHLDTQDERSKRLMEIAETFPQALDKLDAFGQRQTDMNDRLASFGTSFEAFGNSFQELAKSTDRLGGVLASIKERDQKRDEQLQSHVERSQRWMTAMLVLTLVGVGAAMTVAIFAIVASAG